MQSFTALKSVLTQLWCKRGTCGTLAEIDDKSVISRRPLARFEQGGARRGAPEAIQVADRFHLVLDLTQAMERELAVNRRQLQGRHLGESNFPKGCKKATLLN